MNRDTYFAIPSRDFTSPLRRSYLVDDFNCRWIGFQTTRAENVTIELDFGLGKFTLVFVQARVVFIEPLKNATEVLVMLFLAFS